MTPLDMAKAMIIGPLSESQVQQLRVICLEFVTEEQISEFVESYDPGSCSPSNLMDYVKRAGAAVGLGTVQSMQLALLAIHYACEASERELEATKRKVKLKNLFGPYVRAE